MPVIPKSQLSLMRKRRELGSLVQNGNIEDILSVEADLFNEIDTAVQDQERCPKALLAELGQVVKLYKEMSSLCCLYADEEGQQR